MLFLVKFGVFVFLPAGRLVGGGKIVFLDQTNEFETGLTRFTG
jgi:hypothetical protein